LEQKAPQIRAGRYRRILLLFPRPLFLRLSFQSHRDGGRRPKSFRERKTREEDDGTVDRWNDKRVERGIIQRGIDRLLPMNDGNIIGINALLRR